MMLHLAILSLSLGATAPDAYELEVRERLRSMAPAALDAFVRATEDRDTGRFSEAKAGFEQVIAAAPQFGPAHRRLAHVLLMLGDNRTALDEARRALDLDPSQYSHLLLAEILASPPFSDVPTARSHIEAALKLAPSYRDAIFMSGYLAARAGDRGALQHAIDAIRAQEPDSANFHHLATYAALLEENPIDAIAHADAAEARGRQRFASSIRNAIPFSALAWARAKRYGPALLVGWAATLGLLFALGLALSAAQIRMLNRQVEASTASPARGERRLLLAYQAVILLTIVFFYASIPLCALLVLVAGGSVIYLFLVVGRIPIKLGAMILIAVVVSLYALVRGIFSRAKDKDPGKLLPELEQPQLYGLLRDVAAELGTRPVEAVYLTPGTEVAVTERGGFFSTLSGRGRRSLILGVAVPDGMTEQQFRAIIAHEYGHFINGDLKIGSLIHQVHLSLLSMLQGTARAGRIARFSPSFWMLMLFYRMYLVVTHGSGRMREVLADRGAALLYGGKAFADGLTHAIQREAQYDQAMQRVAEEFLAHRADRPANVYALLAKPDGLVNATELEATVKGALERTLSKYDSHPPPAQRIEWTRRFPSPAMEHGRPAEDLIADLARLKTEMMADLESRLRNVRTLREASAGAG